MPEDYVVEHGFTQIIAPTHVTDGANDPWIPVDTESTRRLRSYLDRRGGASVQIIYSLALPYAAFRDATQRRVVIEALKTVPINALWLRIDGFGSSSSATAARMYIQAAADFHSLGVPVVGDHVGGMIGLALLAFGALGGISHGITFGERFETAPWRRPRNENGFGIGRRVYIPALDVMLKPRDAKALLESSTKARSMFGCADPKCCPRGVKDMLENPARHFVYQRMKEIAGLSQIPESLRPQRFLDHHLRPATDKAVASTTINWEREAMEKKMRENRRRLDSLRIALGSHAERHPPGSFATLPKTRAARESRR